MLFSWDLPCAVTYDLAWEKQLSKKRLLVPVFVESQNIKALLHADGRLGVGTGKASLNGS